LSASDLGMRSSAIGPNEFSVTWSGNFIRTWFLVGGCSYFQRGTHFCTLEKNWLKRGRRRLSGCTFFGQGRIEMQLLCLWMIRGYRLMISPLYGRTCRFEPSCSQYASDAIRKYGALQGIGLAILRLMKCHPFHPGGEDPVK
jgi:hypothetical protein